ncbi:hypothetical protein [Paenibacillus jilunlii]|uniref:Uncharacterized protein n=1 Tax=Paenibacillus jilunlii TaxID=682956 RepID=A0A1H0AD13_9BACL|nr:hypothetical protein [Paenibacillus jilunlii]KWX79913.1 hypothetical protein AML91_01725 [Paenibacillus jilunlii]SDN31355.1 hypothetical protein SAMN05216191_13711 [Paenibacillus jilunlii]
MGLWDTAPSFNNPPNFNDLEEVKKYLKDNINKIARSFQDIDSIINGYISSANVREIAGYTVNQTDLASKDKAVGLSSKRDPDPTVDDLRIWAGDADRDQAAFRVYESGFVVLTKFLLQSLVNAFPRIEMDSEGNLLTAKSSADHYMAIDPNYAGTPALKWVFAGAERGGLNDVTGVMELLGIGGLIINVSGGNLDMNVTGTVNFANWNKLYNNDTDRTLQQDLTEIFDRLEAGGL